MLRILSTILILGLSNNAYAEISQSAYNKCKAINDGLERLVCYDELDKEHVTSSYDPQPDTRSDSIEKPFQKQQAIALQPSSEGIGNWQVHVDKNQANMSKSKATASIFAISSFPDVITPRLVVHCNSRNTRLYIDWGTTVAKVQRYNVTIDDQKFPSPRWNSSKNKLLTFYPRKVIGMMREMFKASQYSVEIEQKDGQKLKAVFDITGIMQAVEPVRYSCGW